MKTHVDVTDDDLRRAWRECKFVNTTFEATMAQPALAITVRHMAEANVRRQIRLAELQRNDRKLAQANDHIDHE